MIFFLTKKIDELLDSLGLVQELRFIVLVLKTSTNNINMTDSPYVIDLSTCNVNNDNDFWSILLSLPVAHPLEDWGGLIVERLIGSGLDTKNGITLLADEPLGNKPMLNVSIPAVLRQYYGRDSTVHGINQRATFGMFKGAQSEGSDRDKFTVKPFCHEMTQMADYLSDLLRFNQVSLKLDDVDLSHDFNSCGVLLYHKVEGLKKQSSLGMHCDMKYSKEGEFNNSNIIRENTPIIIVTIGKERVLKWTRRMSTLNKKESVNGSKI